MRFSLLVLIALFILTEIGYSQTRIRPGALEFSFSEVTDELTEGMPIVPPLRDNQGIVAIRISGSHPEYLSQSIVRSWINDNLLRIAGLRYTIAQVRNLGNSVVTIRYEYEFLPGQSFVTQNVEFRGSEYFQVFSARLNFHKSQVTWLDLNIKPGEAPEEILLTSRGVLQILSNVENFTLQYQDEDGFPIVRPGLAREAVLQLEAGSYELVFSKDGFSNIERVVDIAPGQTNSVEVNFEAVSASQIVSEVMRPSPGAPATFTPSEDVSAPMVFRKQRPFLRFMVFTTLTSASLYGGYYFYNEILTQSGTPIPTPPPRPQ